MFLYYHMYKMNVCVRANLKDITRPGNLHHKIALIPQFNWWGNKILILVSSCTRRTLWYQADVPSTTIVSLTVLVSATSHNSVLVTPFSNTWFATRRKMHIRPLWYRNYYQRKSIIMTTYYSYRTIINDYKFINEHQSIGMLLEHGRPIDWCNLQPVT